MCRPRMPEGVGDAPNERVHLTPSNLVTRQRKVSTVSDHAHPSLMWSLSLPFTPTKF